jgi:hypothetical protein
MLSDDLREGPREYRPTYTYIGCGKILDFEFARTI